MHAHPVDLESETWEGHQHRHRLGYQRIYRDRLGRHTYPRRRLRTGVVVVSHHTLDLGVARTQSLDGSARPARSDLARGTSYELM